MAATHPAARPLAAPRVELVPAGGSLAHHSFIASLAEFQVVEEPRGYGGSIESISVERDALGEKQQLQPLLVVKRGLHPHVCGARQDAFCERQDVLLGVEFVDRLGVVVDLCERQLLAQPVALPFVALGVDRLLEEERVIEAVQLLLNQLDALLLLDRPVLRLRPPLLPNTENPVVDQANVAGCRCRSASSCAPARIPGTRPSRPASGRHASWSRASSCRQFEYRCESWSSSRSRLTPAKNAWDGSPSPAEGMGIKPIRPSLVSVKSRHAIVITRSTAS